MHDYYLKGEERFGPITSRLYPVFCNTGHAKELYSFVAADLETTRAKRFLDVGTGTGTIPIMLARQNPKREFYAVDPSGSMVKIARKSGRGIENLRFGLGSSRSVPFRVRFDVIFTSLSFHHWREKEQSLKYLAGLLARGGEIRIYEFDRNKAGRLFGMFGSHMLTLADMAKSSERAGLKFVSSKENGGVIRATLKPARGNK